MKSKKYCKISLYHSEIPGIEFDENGISNYAKNILWRIKNETFNNKNLLKKKIDKIKYYGKGKKYDCVIGVSGGVDSSYVAILVKQFNLRVLAVHLDNGWNSNLATQNIYNLIKRLDIDLITRVVDWDEFKDLQLAYFKSSVMDLENIADQAIDALMYQTAYEQKIKYVIHGGNVVTESGMPDKWAYDSRDSINLLEIHKKFGRIPIKTYPVMKPHQLFYYLYIKRIKSFPILNYVNYNKNNAIETLKKNFNYEPYANKHGENIFTKFYQDYFLPTKFNIDKRIPHLSAEILSNQITLQEGKKLISKKLLNQEENLLINYVAKKLGISSNELLSYVNGKKIEHTNYKNIKWLFNHNNILIKIARKFAKDEYF